MPQSWTKRSVFSRTHIAWVVACLFVLQQFGAIIDASGYALWHDGGQNVATPADGANCTAPGRSDAPAHHHEFSQCCILCGETSRHAPFLVASILSGLAIIFTGPAATPASWNTPDAADPRSAGRIGAWLSRAPPQLS